MKDRKNLKALLSVLLTLILVFAALVPAGIVFQNKFSTNKFLDRQNIQEFYSLEKNTIDLLCIGSSQIMNGFVAGEVYAKHGITAYGLGTCSQPVYAAYHWLLEASKYQKPKAVLYEVSRLYGKNVPMNYTKAFTEMKNTSPIKFKALSGLDLTAEEFIAYYSDVYAFHSRFNELSKDDYAYLFGGNKKTYFGAALSERVFEEYELDSDDYAFEDAGNAPETDDSEYAENILYFEKIVSYCKKNGIDLILFKTTKEDWTADNHAGAKALADKHGLDFLDLNLKENIEKIGFDFEKDFIDPEHYNYFGAVKATDFVADFIAENYDLPDRKEGEDFIKSYDKRYEEYLHAVNNIMLGNSESLDDILKYIDNDKYTVVIAKRGHADLTPEQEEKLFDIGFTAVMSENINSVFVKSEGRIYENGSSKEKIAIRNTAGTNFYYAYSSGGKVMAKTNSASIKLTDVDGISIAVFDNATKRTVLEFAYETKA